ncbi:DNA polymerase II [Candidatus Woesearchaeota archaeon]|nr:DNA polymerase II [Candidatus Woesearchaeota archaeon]
MKGFILYSTHKEIDGKPCIFLYGKLENNETFVTMNSYKPYFYIKKTDLKKALTIDKFEHEESSFRNFDHEDVVKIIVNFPSEVTNLREKFKKHGIDYYEADLKFVQRFLIDKGINSSLEIKGEYERHERADRVYKEPELKGADFFPELKLLSVDIETSTDGKILYCVGMHGKNYSKVFLNSKHKVSDAINCKNEIEVLLKFKEEFMKYDADVITGWNFIDFDLKFLEKKFDEFGIEFDLGRSRDKVIIRKSKKFFSSSSADMPGRQVLDGINLMTTSFIKLDGYKLDAAANQILGKRKTIGEFNKYKEIERMYRDDPKKFVEYNLNDCKLVYEIIQKTNVLNLSIQRSLLTGMTLDKVHSSIASLDSLYIKEAIKRKLVCPTGKYEESEERITGGYVMESKPGIYDYVLVLDFKSLYPSVIKTFNIDPYSFTKIKANNVVIAPNNAMFRNEDGILPMIIQRLHEEREKAKSEKNDSASYAIKILQNSFFGVLASPNCRFYNLDIANAITHFARYLIQLTAKKINEMKYEVIYSDTDSCFLISNAKSHEEAKKIGEKIEKEINGFYDEFIKKEFKRKSFLELEFDKCFIRFLMPKLRHEEKGAKKRYAGLIINEDGKEEISFTGLEAIRSDWTDAAKKFQYELFDKIFHKQEVSSFIKKFVEDLKNGKYDDLLVYKKTLRKGLKNYTKISPQHVQAARKLDKLESNVIEYYITTEGPEPKQKLKHKIDYDHYVKKQIKPIADSILTFFDKDFDDMIKGNKQTSLFKFSK